MTWTWRFAHETKYSLFGVVPLEWMTGRSHKESLHQFRLLDGVLCWIEFHCIPRDRILRALEQLRLRRDAWSLEWSDGPAEGMCLFASLSGVERGDPCFVVERAIGSPTTVYSRGQRQVWEYAQVRFGWDTESRRDHLPADGEPGVLRLYVSDGKLAAHPLAPPDPEAVDLVDFDNWDQWPRRVEPGGSSPQVPSRSWR